VRGDSVQVKEAGTDATAARKRAAVETIAREGAELRKAARRYSLCEEDAEDAYQRGLEILLLKAPSDRPRDLVPWAKTVIKHEALAIRRYRERMLGTADGDPGAWIPAKGDGPDKRAEIGEHVARSREALGSLKPAELRALTLLAAGYSYAEIGEITGFSRTKVNRCLAEGRDRFRRQLSRSEDGSRCAEMGSLLSAYCDGETGAEDAATVREHLRACAGCRATMRAYRQVPAAVAALAPALPVSRSLLERGQEFLLSLQARLPGGGAADTGVAQVAATGGARGAGAAALAKLLAVCASAAGGAACVATGVAPVPLDLAPQRMQGAAVERISEQVVEASAPTQVEYVPAPPAPEAETRPEPQAEKKVEQQAAPEPTPGAEAGAGAVEYAPPPEAEPTPPSSPATGMSTDSAAGEFGP